MASKIFRPKSCILKEKEGLFVIDFIPGQMRGVQINTGNTSKLAEEYSLEIQKRSQMAQVAADCVKKALNNCGIYSGELKMSPSAMAAVLSPAVGPDLKKGDEAAVIKTPLRLQFIDEENNVRADAVIAENIQGGKTLDISIQVYRIIDGEAYIYNYEKEAWLPLEKLQKKHELIQVMEMETGFTFSQEDEQRILAANRKLIDLYKSFPVPRLMRYSSFGIGDSGDASEVHACLIPSNPNCTGVVVLIDEDMGGKLSLCQRFMGMELEEFCQKAAGKEGTEFLEGFHNEWIAVAFADDGKELLPVLTGMLDHYTAGAPVCVFPLSMKHYANLVINKDGVPDISLSTEEKEELTQEEQAALGKILEKLHL